MTNPPGAMPPLPGPLNAEVLADLMTLHGRATKGVWAQGTSSHHTVAKREGKEDYHVANFHHADDASFADVAHKYMPLLIARVAELQEALQDAVTRMDRARDILTDGKPTPQCNWGMLDTNTLRAAIAAKD